MSTLFARVGMGWSRCGLLGLAFLLLGRAPLAAGAGELPLPMITDPATVWAMSTDEKAQIHLLQIAGRISYCDPSFRILWIEQNGVGAYVQLSEDPPSLVAGQAVEIAGKFTPSRGLEAKNVTVRVVAGDVPIAPLVAKNRINDFAALHGRVVTVEGYVDSQQFVDSRHIRLTLIVENRPVICWVNPDDPAHVPDWQGHFIQATGLYSRKFDPSQTSASIEVWMGRQEGLKILGTMDRAGESILARTPVSELYLVPLGREVRVAGSIETHRVGTSMTIRDETGQVEIRSIQQQRLPVGATVEAVGRVALSSGQWVVEQALYRSVAAREAEAVPLVAERVLKTVAQVRALSTEEAARGLAVDLSGMVTWSLPGSDFLFLQDLTGGIRVYYDRAKMGDVRFGKYFHLAGVSRGGRIAPAVEMRSFVDLGSMSHPPAKPVTLVEALSGKEDGEWVEMRGFLRATISEGDWRWIHVTTPEGDFTGHLQNPVTFVANAGSLIRLHGVCETTADASGHITGITLRVPFLHDIAIEEDAPADYYDLPRRTLADLAQIGSGKTMQRVRVTGTVVHAVKGRSVYMEEGAAGLLLLTRETESLRPGDRIEAVGILGREGVRTILREVVLRKTGSGPEPTPLVLDKVSPLEPAADSRLVRLRGTLIDVFSGSGKTRLTLQQDNTLFEALFDQPANAARLALPLGSGLEVTGIYKLVFDDSHQSRAFQLQLRSPGDIKVYAPARLWTVPRALAVAAVLGGCVLLGLAWIRALRRQVSQQTEQMREQMEQRARLEAEVQRAARLESLGVLAGGIAHEYNNLLTIILGNLSLLKYNPLVMGTESERVSEIEHGALRARDLTRKLLTFAAGGEPLCVPADLPGLTRAAAKKILGKTKIHCTYEIAADLRLAQVDEEQISQALENVLSNAVEAMPVGGTVRIVLANVQIAAGSFNLTPGAYLKLAIIDTGMGIPAEALPKIFDPFFTTKTFGGGLGLATVYSIIKKHRGYVEAHSEVGQGTTFTLWLPVAEPVLQTAPVKSPVVVPVAAEPVALARVLLLDDEDSIRRLGTILLKRMGLDPTTVPDGATAMREFAAAHHSGRPFSLLILDLTIPGGIGGKATLDAIRKTAEGVAVPAIVSSGYSRDPVMANFREHGFQAVVPKPYDIGKFTETVRILLSTDQKG